MRALSLVVAVLSAWVVAVPRVEAGPAAVGVSGDTPFHEPCGVVGVPDRASEVEPSLAVNPTDAGNLVAVWQQDRFASHGGALSNVVGASFDGGATWTRVLVPGVSRCTGGRFSRATDPWLSFGPDGVAYLVSLAFDGDVTGPNALLVHTSRDGGLSWSGPSTVVEDVAFMLNDRETITADPAVPGRAYVVWARFVGAAVPLTFVSITTDHGRTWTSPLPIGSSGQGNEILGLPSGALLDVYLGTGGISVQRSDTGGLTWGLPVRVAAPRSEPVRDFERAQPVRTQDAVPTADVGPDGTAWVAWQESGLETSRIMVSRSSDGGATWTPPVAAATVRGYAFMPSIAVDGTGRPGIGFYDFRNDVPGDDELTTDVWTARSSDGGATWTEEHLMGPFDMRGSPYAEGRFLGDYQGAAGLPDGHAALFAVSAPMATAGRSDVFFARSG